MKRAITKVLVVASAVLVLGTFVMSCSEPPPPPEPETAKPETTKPAQPMVPQPAAPAAETPAEPARQPLVVWIEADPEEGKAPLKVQFTAMLKGGTPPMKIVWTFGDDSEPSSETNPVHTYTKPGTYLSEITVEDSGDDEDDDYLEIVVE